MHLATLNAVYVILDSAANISYLDRHAAPLIQADVLEYADSHLRRLQLDKVDPDCDQTLLATHFTVLAILARLRGRSSVGPETSVASQELEDGPLVGRIFAKSLMHIAMVSCVHCVCWVNSAFCRSEHLLAGLAACMPVCLSVCLAVSVCLSVCFPVCLLCQLEVSLHTVRRSS